MTALEGTELAHRCLLDLTSGSLSGQEDEAWYLHRGACRID